MYGRNITDNPRLPFLREKAAKLPSVPGIYRMRNASGTVIYVGKAKVLKNRVSSYFRGVRHNELKTDRLVENIHDFDYIVTDSEFEAFILECSMIKEHNPKYNIRLKDATGYSYIRIAPLDGWSRITAERRRETENAEHIGPYSNGTMVRQTVEEANNAFRLPTCTRQFPDSFGRSRPCLRSYINKCAGWCKGKYSFERYRETLEQAREFIRTGGESTILTMTAQMEAAAEDLDFERAAELRDKIAAIRRITEQQKVMFVGLPEQDAIAVARSSDQCCVAVLRFRGQRLADKEDFLFAEVGDVGETVSLFAGQYYQGTNEIPRRISLHEDCADRELLERMLSERAGYKVTVTVPQRGDQRDITEMAYNNAVQKLAHESERNGREIAALDELGRLLGLPGTPLYIEAYDISNIGSDVIVGGMVVFESARPKKSAYRRFKMKDVTGPDDYASMCEMLRRRFGRYLSEEGAVSEDNPPEGFAVLPDLILLDGGKGHVSAVEQLLREMGIDVPVFGMVKDDSHRTRAIAVTGGEIAIRDGRAAFTLVSKIQNEAHRFAIEYSRGSHTKRSFELLLTQIPGVGSKRAVAMLRHFKTMKAIRCATAAQLAEVPGMSAAAAQNVEAFFKKEQGEALK